MDLEFNKNEDINKLRLAEINQLYTKIKKGGGEKALQKQRDQGKLTARERISYLLDDDNDAIEIAAFAGNFIPMFLFPIAETKVSSSIAGIMNSMMPIFTIIVGALFWKTKTNSRQILGICISFAGVVLLMNSGNEKAEMPVFYVGLLLLAAFLYAVSVTTVGAKLTHIPAKIMSSFVFFYVLALPSLISLYLSNFFSEFSFSKESFVGLGFVATLSVVGTGLAMMLHYRLMSVSNPLFASTVTLLMPIVAVIWGVLDGEQFTKMQVLGAGIILAGLIFLRKKKV